LLYQPEDVFCSFDKAFTVLARLIPCKPGLAFFLREILFFELLGEPGKYDGMAILEFLEELFGRGTEKLHLGHPFEPSSHQG